MLDIGRERLKMLKDRKDKLGVEPWQYRAIEEAYNKGYISGFHLQCPLKGEARKLWLSSYLRGVSSRVSVERSVIT